MEQPREISFRSGKADCAGWWWAPASSPGPAIVLGHGLGGVYAARLDAYARRFHAGGHVVTLAARDPRIAALVAQVPFMDGVVNARALPPWQALRLTAAGLRDAL